MLGRFETSLRGGDSPSPDRKYLHRGCCGHLHGHGVPKGARPARAPVSRTASNRSVSLEIRSRHLDVASASLRAHARLSGLRRVMHGHPVLSSCVGISSIATVVFTLVYLFWSWAFEPAVVVQLPAKKEDRVAKARELLDRSRSQRELVRRVVEEASRSNSCEDFGAEDGIVFSVPDVEDSPKRHKEVEDLETRGVRKRKAAQE